MRGGNVDDAAPVPPEHLAQRGPDRQKGCRQIDGNDRIPAIQRKFLDRRGVLDTGVIHQDIDAAELVRGQLDHARNIGWASHIGRAVAHAHPAVGS